MELVAYDVAMTEKMRRSELNYVISGLIVLVLGGYLVNIGQDDGGLGLTIPGFVLIAAGIFLLIKGVLRGRR